MIDTIEFGKKINHRPIIISFLVSFLVSIIGLTANIKVSILSFLLVLFLLLCIYFPFYLPKLFGHWQLENHGISYYKMTTYRDKLKLIFSPNHADFQFISYSQIKSFNIHSGNQQYSINDILTIKPDKQSIFPWLRKPFYLELVLNQTTADLDLSFDQLHDPDHTLYRLTNVLQILEKKVN